MTLGRKLPEVVDACAATRRLDRVHDPRVVVLLLHDPLAQRCGIYADVLSPSSRLRFLSPRQASARMPGDWEVRGIFGNEYALEGAVDELKKLDKVPDFKVLDRRNLQVLVTKSDTQTRELVKKVIMIAHGYVEADGPLGHYDAKRAEIKRRKMKEYEEKRKAALQGH